MQIEQSITKSKEHQQYLEMYVCMPFLTLKGSSIHREKCITLLKDGGHTVVTGKKENTRIDNTQGSVLMGSE